MYLRRILLPVTMWFIGYVTVYAFSAGVMSMLTSLGYRPPEAGVIVAVGASGFLACGIAVALWAEKLDRKVWLPISAAITVLGSVIVAAAGDTRVIAFAGAAIIFFGFNLWVPMTYARSAESFPTRARTTGFALVDGVGHLGGGIGVLVIAPLIPKMSVFGAFMLVSGLVVAAVLEHVRRGDAQQALRGDLAVACVAVAGPAASDLPVVAFETASEWEAWLREHHDSAPGVWIKFARKGSGVASVTYMEALHAALCFGWIDGQARSLDEGSYVQRFTPRRARSIWSKRNREFATALIESGRMQPAGLREVERAKADGRWDAAYDAPSTATVPDDLRAALDASPDAAAFFETLNAQNRYAILHRIQTAKRAETRARRIETFVAMLARGERLHP